MIIDDFEMEEIEKDPQITPEDEGLIPEEELDIEEPTNEEDIEVEDSDEPSLELEETLAQKLISGGYLLFDPNVDKAESLEDLYEIDLRKRQQLIVEDFKSKLTPNLQKLLEASLSGSVVDETSLFNIINQKPAVVEDDTELVREYFRDIYGDLDEDSIEMEIEGLKENKRFDKLSARLREKKIESQQKEQTVDFNKELLKQAKEAERVKLAEEAKRKEIEVAFYTQDWQDDTKERLFGELVDGSIKSKLDSIIENVGALPNFVKLIDVIYNGGDINFNKLEEMFKSKVTKQVKEKVDKAVNAPFKFSKKSSAPIPKDDYSEYV